MTKHCQCDCGESALREFLPGHDQKLRIAIEQKIGGLISLKRVAELVNQFLTGKIDEVELGRLLKI